MMMMMMYVVSSTIVPLGKVGNRKPPSSSSVCLIPLCIMVPVKTSWSHFQSTYSECTWFESHSKALNTSADHKVSEYGTLNGIAFWHHLEVHPKTRVCPTFIWRIYRHNFYIESHYCLSMSWAQNNQKIPISTHHETSCTQTNNTHDNSAMQNIRCDNFLC